MKRALDIAVSAATLVILSPVLILVAFLVRLDSPGPAIFRQVRVGHQGAQFTILKFRTMYVAEPGGPEITARSDRRVTRIGKHLRRTKVDELPQLINVLRGEMSLVGPRPEVPSYMALYTPPQRALILSVKPGVTDLAALEFRNEEELLAAAIDPHETYVQDVMPRKYELYKQYVDHHNVRMDIVILWRTAAALVRRR